MNISWDALGVILGPGGAVVVLAELIRRDRQTKSRDREAQATAETVAANADVAAVRAAEAADLARPTGNGYAATTLAALARIESSQRQQADISGRTVARLDRVMERLDGHIDDHLRGVVTREGGS